LVGGFRPDMSRWEHGETTLFVDFDGTIVDADTAQIALDRFGDHNWKLIDEALERGEISFEESLRREFATLRAPPEVIIREVSRVTNFRPNFDKLIQYCRTNNLLITVVSGGLDFCIRHFLDRDEWMNSLKICAPTSRFTGNGYVLTFPTVSRDGAINFKDRLVMREKRNGKHVFFVGNGFGDLAAAKEASFAFAIKGSRLAELCREQSIRIEEIDDFSKVVDALDQRSRAV
jgi:HAD superfamily phosphoserine phosphatase-like hydrolase